MPLGKREAFLLFRYSSNNPYPNEKVYGCSFEETCHRSIAPIVAAARCFVSGMWMQRLQRIAGLAMIREEKHRLQIIILLVLQGE
ncbi:MAG: hypothetical protein WCL14_11870 [Bacteroidota bacterium]